MGVFKWLRRERVTVETRGELSTQQTTNIEGNIQQVGTIRTEQYKRDLAEFQARRSLGNRNETVTPVKKKSGRHSLPVSCTKCTTELDGTFNYEKKSSSKYKKNKRSNAIAEQHFYEGVPNIQFLFQNQVFMPGDIIQRTPYTEPLKSKHYARHNRSHELDLMVSKQIDFKQDEDKMDTTPLFYKNNSLPFDEKHFLEGSSSEEEASGGRTSSGDDKTPSQNSPGINKDDSCEEKLWEVMGELKCFDRWADEQLKMQFSNVSTSEDNKSNTSALGLPIASACNLDVTVDKVKMWNYGTWGVVPIQMKKMVGVTLQQVKMKQNMEINILRKCRHPNILLLMGLYPDIQDNVHLICEKCDYTLFDLLHVQGRKPSIQTSVHYALDIANALTFLSMHGYIHTELSSLRVMVTSRDTAKLADLTTCITIDNHNRTPMSKYDMYSPEPQYVNIEETKITTPESQVLLTQSSSEAYLLSPCASKPYDEYCTSEHYRWHAPELFDPDGNGNVHPCSRTDVYSLCVILWECCNATVPWKALSYEELKDFYLEKLFDSKSKTGITIPQDGTYPGCLLSTLQNGLKLQRSERITLENLQNTLQVVKNNLDCMEYIVLPEKLSKRKSNFSTAAWDTTSPTSDSDFQTDRIEHKAIVHKNEVSSADSERSDSKKSDTPYETIAFATKCYVSDDDTSPRRPLKMDRLPEKEYSSACSTPITKIRTRVRDIGTPGALHKSDSTEYCSIMSPEFRNFGFNDTKDQSDEKPATKLSRSFTPKSYRPLHIKVPDFNLDSLKSLPKGRNCGGRSSYSFDVSNYSLPTTPIARSNKLRKNAWLSGELTSTDRSENTKDRLFKVVNKRESAESSPEPQATSEKDAQLESDRKADDCKQVLHYKGQDESNKSSIENETAEGIRVRIGDFSQKRDDQPRSLPSEKKLLQEKVTSWRVKSNLENEKKQTMEEEDVLANVNVKPLVAIHEKWIYEANRKTGRSMSLPEETLRCTIPAVKPASHCVDTLQKSLPQLTLRRGGATRASHPPPSPTKDNRSGFYWEQYCQARDKIAKSMNIERFKTWTKREISREEPKTNELKVDQATDTRSIEEFIRGLVRKEFQHLANDNSNSDNISPRKEEMLDKGVANIVQNLNKCEEDFEPKKESVKSFSRVKINGNNKPLLHITFNRSGENSLQVLDNCVNVTICDPNNSGREKNTQAEESPPEEVHLNSLKRCQAFNAIQEARSTEDLYIDDDISAQMQENFGGKVKLIPLHGSLHEILCEKEDECCLIKVKQENGCDTIYFRCDNSDTESKDAVDGNQDLQDTVVFKRSISLVEERFQRVLPRDKRPNKKRNDEIKPKSEVYLRNITKESRVLSNSSPSLVNSEPVEVNIESVLCYEDSSASSDECLKCQENEEFELLERKIEEDLAGAIPSLGCLGKISEENLSVINEDVDKDHVSLNDSGEIIKC